MQSLQASESDAIASKRHLVAAAAMLVMVFVVSLRAFELLWHRDAVADIARQAGGWTGAIIIVACSAVVHELLHAFAWHTFAGVPWRSISFRPSWRVMGFVAHANVAMPARAYRTSTALPALILGAIPIVLGFVTGSGLFVLWGLFFLLECFADVAVLFAMHNVPSRAWVRDHPDRLGCRVVADGS